MLIEYAQGATFSQGITMLRRTLCFSLLASAAVLIGAADGQDTKKTATPSVDKLLEPDTFKDDLRIVREGGIKGEPADLLEYFRKRTLKQPDPKEIAALVKQLGADEFAVREKAFAALLDMEASALAGLKEGESDPSLEVRKRVADLKERIDNKAEPIKQAAAARILVKLKPAGTVETLLAFLPFSNDVMVVDEICKTLGTVGVVNGKPDPALVQALADPIAVKRGAAAEALVRGGAKNERAAVKGLLKDKDATVRLRIGLAMLPLEEKDAVAVLIDLLADLSADQLMPVEEALVRLAGEQAPTVALGTDAPTRKSCRDAWADWHATALKENKLDMTRLTRDNVYLGYTLVVQMNNRIGPGGPGGGIQRGSGDVYELDKDKRVRWKIELNTQPVDAQVVAGNRVLIAEFLAGKVTERDFKGDIKWECPCGGNPIAVQRLPNGNTFVATQTRLAEFDRNKSEVWSFQRQQPDIVRARKLPNGDVIVVHHNNFVGNGNSTCLRIDAKTKDTVKSFNCGSIQMFYGNIDVLADGHVLIPHYQQHNIVEYDADGSQVKSFRLNWPNAVQRLPSGNTLVSSYSSRQIVEFDTNGSQVATQTVDGLISNIRRR